MSVTRNLSLALPLVALLGAGPAAAFNYVTDANGTWWGIQDAAPPRVDTGSIRATQIGPGQAAALSTTINGFGGIRVRVQTLPEPRFNGELMRGWGLQFDGVSRFRSTRSLDLGGVRISRSVFIQRSAHWGRWLDTFTNTTAAPLTIQVAFGGQSGIGAASPNSSAIVNTSSGDAAVTPADAWVTVATPLAGDTLVGGPQVTVLGSPSTPEQPFAGALGRLGHWLHNPFTDPFSDPVASSGHDANFQGYVRTLTLAPGQSQSLAHFIVLGARVNAESAGAVQAAVEATATRLAAAPELADLTPAEVCSITNFKRSALAANGFDASACAPAGSPAARVAQPAVARQAPAQTRIHHDVVGKTIAQLRADLDAGRVSSRELTQAYLDRIAVYDRGPFGFNAFEIVAADALAQAAAADRQRQRGRRGPLLGIPIAVKNNFDTADLPTTNGSRVFEGFRPRRDAFQVARLRAAGAVIIGKAALEEYATAGHYSNDAWGQVWNVFQPSRSALGSSGGSASAVAASLAAAALGSQTGNSLYGPASGASLVTLRGTDGLQSGNGILPLVYLTDFGGALARSVPDLADLLNVLVAVDPGDRETSAPGRRVPADWRQLLDAGALRGKRIGFIPSAWVDPLGTTETVAASRAALQVLVDAGARIVEMGVTVGGADLPPAPPAPPGNIRAEGWAQYIDHHPELAAQGFGIRTVVDVDCAQKKVAYVRADASTCAETPPPRLTPEQLQAFRDYRRGRQATAKVWMDTAGQDGLGVDAVVYPGLLSDISLNDGGGSRASFGRRDTPSAANGLPSIAFPAGRNEHGQPINLQLLGRAWDDDRLLAMAYAFEHLAQAAGRGHVEATTAPPLTRLTPLKPLTPLTPRPPRAPANSQRAGAAGLR